MSAPSLKTRLKRLAVQMGVCAIHGTRLLRGPCHYTWTGTDKQFWELWPLSERLSPYSAYLTPSGCVCRDCGKDRGCRPCYEMQARQIQVPADLFTEAELARYTELLGYMRPKPR